LVLARALPAGCPTQRAARPCLPSSGSHGLWFPTCAGTMRCSDCRPPPLGALRSSRAARSLACCRTFVVSLAGAWAGGSPRPRQGFGSSGPPVRAWGPGERGLAHVPAFPLERHAPRSDPGGVLTTRPGAVRTAACRPGATVGLPRRILWRDSLVSTTLRIAGLPHAACLRAPSSAVRPLRGVHVECAPARLARRWPGRTCTIGAHLLGHNDQLHGLSPSPKVSGLPWRDHCFVRLGTPLRLLIGLPHLPGGAEMGAWSSRAPWRS
jgi:hypothetical protein